LWVGTNQGLAKLNANLSADTIPLEKISDKTINAIYLQSNSDTWFGTAKGITLNRSDLWQKEKFKKNLSGTVTALTFEKNGINSIACWDGDCYFATNGRSIFRTFDWDETADAFSGASQLLYPYNGESLTDTMHVVFIDSKGQQWFGGQEGLQVHVGHDPKMDNTSFYEELVGQVIHCIAEANDGKIWVGTEDGISVYDGANWVGITAVLPDLFVTAIAFDKDGKAWVGTKKGLVTIENQ
jgi:ligand-binding sensor domain-containing protein